MRLNFIFKLIIISVLVLVSSTTFVVKINNIGPTTWSFTIFVSSIFCQFSSDLEVMALSKYLYFLF